MCWFDAIASSKEATVFAMLDDDDDEEPDAMLALLRDCKTWRTACGKMLFGSAVDGFELFINLRRFDDMPEI